jgi:hypothetical protein
MWQLHTRLAITTNIHPPITATVAVNPARNYQLMDKESRRGMIILTGIIPSNRDSAMN